MGGTKVTRRILAALLAALLLAGCVTVPQKTEPGQSHSAAAAADFDAVAVVPAFFKPELVTRYIKGRGAGFFTGALVGVLAGAPIACFALAEQGVPQEFWNELLPYVLPVSMGIGAATYSLSCAARAVPAQRAEEIEAEARGALERYPLQEVLARRIVEAGNSLSGPRFSLPAGGGPSSVEERPVTRDAVLEVAVLEVRLESRGEGKGRLLVPRITARARLIRVSDRRELGSLRFSVAVKPYRIADPAADPTARHLEAACRELAEQAVDRLFLINDFLAGLPFAPGGDAAAVRPRSRYRTPLFGPTRLDPAETGSLRPRFSWPAFPGPAHRARDKAGRLEEIGPVTYDFRIWRAEGEYLREELVYEAAGLSEPRHVPEVPLLPGLRYAWGVRARFTLDGRPRATPWYAPPVLCFATPAED
jgi:hypothetical protein